jgi:hypothetical protein
VIKKFFLPSFFDEKMKLELMSMSGDEVKAQVKVGEDEKNPLLEVSW